VEDTKIGSAADRLARAWITIGWAGVIAVTVLSLIPVPSQLIPLEEGDKAAHLVAFGGLMFWFAQVYLQRGARLATAVLLLALGVAIEFVQRETGYRSFEYADMGADCVGIVLGWMLAPPRLPNLLAWSQRWLRVA
jgi:VanZ like family